MKTLSSHGMMATMGAMLSTSRLLVVERLSISSGAMFATKLPVFEDVLSRMLCRGRELRNPRDVNNTPSILFFI